MIDRQHDLPITQQEKSLGSAWQRLLSAAAGLAGDLAIMRRIDELHLELPFAGIRICAIF